MADTLADKAETLVRRAVAQAAKEQGGSTDVSDSERVRKDNPGRIAAADLTEPCADEWRL